MTVAPPLRSGDRLDAAESHRRRDARPEAIRAELLDGVVHVHRPTARTSRSELSMTLLGLFGLYRFKTPGLRGFVWPSIRLDDRNVPQPEGSLLVRPELGGTTAIDTDGFLAGPPELAVEIVRTATDDAIHQKLAVYRRFGFGEVLVWRTADAAFDHLQLVDGDYRPIPAGPEGVRRSRRFPGLWIDTAALVDGRDSEAAETLQRGIDSPEHAAFAAELNRRQVEAGQPAVIPRPSRRTGL